MDGRCVDGRARDTEEEACVDWGEEKSRAGVGCACRRLWGTGAVAGERADREAVVEGMGVGCSNNLDRWI
jgi:hypothetical protein